jgi:DNA excision repair protein ERCC-5
MLLQSFGIPYITAPMEAEAQCAELANLRLVDGIITDDSDVFLFGGSRCYKNLFNDSKYVECYLAADILRELSLTRDRLVTMAFLLGSDYATGLPGVGYVTAMEIMAEFPGEGDEGLIDFRTWWLKVQSGRDTEADTDTRWKKAFVRARFHSGRRLPATDPISLRSVLPEKEEQGQPASRCIVSEPQSGAFLLHRAAKTMRLL